MGVVETRSQSAGAGRSRALLAGLRRAPLAVEWVVGGRGGPSGCTAAGVAAEARTEEEPLPPPDTMLRGARPAPLNWPCTAPAQRSYPTQ